jgi:3-oxoadipate enol-lactonase
MEWVTLRDNLTIAYEDDWYGPPWATPETILLIHGIAESSVAWREWVPYLSGTLRVLRIDLPGFGRSTAPKDYDWHWRRVAADLASFLAAIGISRVHLVGAKYGGSLAMGFAIVHGSCVATLSAVGAPAAVHLGHKRPGETPPDLMRQLGIPGWATKTMRARLGSNAPDAKVRWWAEQLMARSDPATCIAASTACGRLDYEGRLADIVAPTLVVTAQDSGIQDVETTRYYQQQIPHSSLVVLRGDGFHIAAASPSECAKVVLNFIGSTEW